MADAAAPAVRSRALSADLPQVAVGVGTAAGITALGAADGGYFPPAWGWTALVTLWLVIAWLLLGRTVLHGGRLPLAFVGGLTALAAWTWLSLLWTGNTTQTALEGFRMLAYAGVAAALVAVLRRDWVPAFLRGVLAAVTLLCLYALGTRLFPDRLGTYDPISEYRLSEPLGYWNGLGIFAALGTLLALGLAARDRSIAVRAFAAAATTVLVPTLFFTFSRGAAIALVVGLAAALALDPRRLQLALTTLVVGAPAAIAVLVASSAEALTHEDSALSSATDQGREVALVILVLAVVAAAAAVGLALAERRFTPSPRVRLAFAVTLVLVVGTLLVGAFARYGGPVTLVEKAHDAFVRPPPRGSERDLRQRLFTFTGGYRAETWEEAWNQFTDHPVAGAGAGTYEQYWLRERPIAEQKVRDAHSLYLESLGELGIVGFAFLALALGAPLVAAFRVRAHPLAAGAAGAYVAYVVHAAIDWDWELPVVTVTGLACGAALIAALGSPGAGLVPGFRFRVAAIAGASLMAVAAFVGLVGSSALAASDDAAVARPPDWDEAAEEARKAQDWAPWSSEPWQRLGDAQVGRGDLAAARVSYRKAIEKEPTDWLLWFRLAEASSGAERRAALREAARLNPLDTQIREFQAEGA